MIDAETVTNRHCIMNNTEVFTTWVQELSTSSRTTHVVDNLSQTRMQRPGYLSAVIEIIDEALDLIDDEDMLFSNHADDWRTGSDLPKSASN